MEELKKDLVAEKEKKKNAENFMQEQNRKFDEMKEKLRD